MILADGPSTQLADGLDRGCSGISEAVRACRPDLFPWMNEKEEQHSRQRDDEGGGNDGRSASVEGIRKGLFEDVEPPTKKCHNDESRKPSEGAHQAAAKNE